MEKALRLRRARAALEGPGGGRRVFLDKKLWKSAIGYNVGVIRTPFRYCASRQLSRAEIQARKTEMNANQPPALVWVPDATGGERMLNLDQVRMVDQITGDHIRLIFSEQHAVDLTGPIVNELLGLLGNACIVLDGTGPAGLMERVASRSRALEQYPDPSLEA